MAKLEKLEREQEKARARIAEYQSKLKELDGAIAEQENVGIAEAIRALKLTRKELRDFISTGILPKDTVGAGAVPEARYVKTKPEVKEQVKTDTTFKPASSAAVNPTVKESEVTKNEG